MSTTQPEALRLASDLESIFISEEIHATKAQKLAAELRRLHARIADLESQLVKDAARSADEKRRADQMTEQHRMQAALNTEARAQLAERAAQESAIGAGGVSPLMGAAGDAGWRDISTAPKDGGYVLLAGKRPEDVASGYWLQSAYAGNGAWIWPFVHKAPTHWAPIPPSSDKGVAL